MERPWGLDAPRIYWGGPFASIRGTSMCPFGIRFGYFRVRLWPFWVRVGKFGPCCVGRIPRWHANAKHVLSRASKSKGRQMRANPVVLRIPPSSVRRIPRWYANRKLVVSRGSASDESLVGMRIRNMWCPEKAKRMVDRCERTPWC